jgi:hypothetical protein
VVLDHLHVHQRRSDAVGLRDPVAGADQRVGGRPEGLARPTRGEDHALGREDLELAVADLARDDPGAVPVLARQQRGDEPLLVAVDALVVAHELLVEHVQQRLAGDVGHVVGARLGGAAEGARPEAALVVAVEGDAQVLEVQDLVGRLAAHDLDRVLVAQVVRSLDGVEGVRLPGVLGVERRVDPARRGVGVRAHGMDLAHDPDRRPRIRRGEGRALAGEAGTDDEDVVGGHGRRDCIGSTCAGRV